MFTFGYDTRWGDYRETDRIAWAVNGMGPFKTKWEAEQYVRTGETMVELRKAWPGGAVTGKAGSKIWS